MKSPALRALVFACALVPLVDASGSKAQMPTCQTNAAGVCVTTVPTYPATGTPGTTSGNPLYVSGGGGGGGGGAVYGPTAAGTAAANPPVLIGGTADGTATGAVSNLKVTGGAASFILSGAIPAGSNAIGSITNTSFGVTQATASALNATVVGTGTFAVQNTAATPAGTNSIGTVVVSTTSGGGTSSNPFYIQGTSATTLLGSVYISQVTPGTTNGVQTLTGSVTTATANGPTAAGSASTTNPVQVGAINPSGNVVKQVNGSAGGIVPTGTTETPTRTSITASTITAGPAALSTRTGLSIQVETATTAPIYICTAGQSSTCSATVYNFQIPSGASAGTIFVDPFNSVGAVYYFSTVAVTVNAVSAAPN